MEPAARRGDSLESVLGVSAVIAGRVGLTVLGEYEARRERDRAEAEALRRSEPSVASSATPVGTTGFVIAERSKPWTGR